MINLRHIVKNFIILKKKYWALLILGVISIFFSVYYHYYSKTLKYSYWDEVQWVGLSYYFQFFKDGDFSRDVWGRLEMAGDQPPLTKYAFGAWLYPIYLKEKPNDKKDFDYTKFLISKGFNFIDTRDKIYPKNDNNWIYKSSIIDYADEGTREYFVDKYGPKVVEALNLIQNARYLNAIFLTITVFIIGYFFTKYKGFLFGLFFAIFYGFNTLILSAGLKAHSETLFLLLFNSSLIALFIYFLKKDFKFLLIFSVLLGFCISTKLNGIMLYFIYLILFVIFLPEKNTILGYLIRLFMPLVIALTIFTVINPFVYPNPLGKTIDMFVYRRKLSYAQANMSFEPVFGNKTEAIVGTFSNFYTKSYFKHYNNIVLNKTNLNLAPVLLVLLIAGIFSEIKKAVSGNKLSRLFFITFVVTIVITLGYLNLNWDRYFVHLVLFVVYYQLSGFILVVSVFAKYLRAYLRL